MKTQAIDFGKTDIARQVFRLMKDSLYGRNSDYATQVKQPSKTGVVVYPIAVEVERTLDIVVGKLDVKYKPVKAGQYR